MAKVLGLREQRVQFFYDTDFVTTKNLTTADSSNVNYAVAQKNLFSDARVCVTYFALTCKVPVNF